MHRFQKCLMVNFQPADLREEDWQRLHVLSAEVVTVGPDDPRLPAQLHDADCLLLASGCGAERAVIEAAPKLAYIGKFGYGTRRIDVGYAESRGIVVTSIPGFPTEGEATAEFAIAVLLEHLRHLSSARAHVDAGAYGDPGLVGGELRGRVLGILGLGLIGGRIAHIAADGFGASVQYWSRTRKPDADTCGFRFMEADELLRTSEILSVNLVGAPEVSGFITAALVEAIRPSAVVVCLSPIQLFDIPALLTRLRRNDLTFIFDDATELPEAQAKELSQMPNCIIYPPIAGLTREGRIAKQRILVDNIELFLQGEPYAAV